MGGKGGWRAGVRECRKLGELARGVRGKGGWRNDVRGCWKFGELVFGDGSERRRVRWCQKDAGAPVHGIVGRCTY